MGLGDVDVEHRLLDALVAHPRPAAVTFSSGARADLGKLAPETTTTTSFAVVVNACLLPPHPTQSGFQAFDYTVKATSASADEVTREVTYHAAVPAPTGSCT